MGRLIRTIYSDQTEFTLFCVKLLLLQWNRIARIVSAAKGFTLWETARLHSGNQTRPQDPRSCRQHLFATSS